MKIVNRKNDTIIRFTIDKVTYNVKLDNGVNDVSNYPVQVKKFLKSYLCNVKDDDYVIYLNKYDSMNFVCDKNMGNEECECIKNNLIVLNENDMTQGELLLNKISSNPSDVKMREFNKNLIKIMRDEIDRIEEHKARYLQNINIPEQEVDEKKKEEIRKSYDLFYVLLERRKEFLVNKLKELENELKNENEIEEENAQSKKRIKKNNISSIDTEKELERNKDKESDKS